MILDPDGEHAMTDDGRMAVRVYASILNSDGFPTGDRQPIGWADPVKFELPFPAVVDHIDLD